MALSIDDIFPSLDESYRILEPKKCLKYPMYPSIVGDSEAGIRYRRRKGKGSARYQYQYSMIMEWEYDLIYDFFIRKKGQYEDFYLVDWSRQYKIVSVANVAAGSCDYTLNSVSGLTSSAGYIGNTLLIYNTRYDPQQGTADKNILTIDSIASTTITTTKGQSGRTHLDTANSYIYALVPALFETDTLSPQMGEACIEKLNPYFAGHGNKYIFGATYSINIPFIQLGVLQE